ncbi:TPA: site-specific DNA-methyltransferase [Klebsiella aerogenes]|nr:site-specific DNA-methyltransferase [Klebsiella aerogenes]
MKYQLQKGDCLEVMEGIPDASIDLILCDLPYGVTGLKWDSIIPLNKLWQQYDRIINGNGAIVLFGTQPFTTALINSRPDKFKYCWIWEKTRKGDVFNAKNKPMRAHEEILVFSAGTTANKSPRRMPYYPQGLTDCSVKRANKETARAFFAPRPSHGATYEQKQTGYPSSVLKFPNEAKTVHPTQKPVALLEYLIRTYTQEGETVLDHCMGSGSTGVACVNTKRNFVGIELEEKYYLAAKARVAHAVNDDIYQPFEGVA